MGTLIDFSRRRLKAVLLHVGKQFASIPVAHLIHLRKSYANQKSGLEKLKYIKHKWLICGDLKIICLLLEQHQQHPNSHVIFVNMIV